MIQHKSYSVLKVTTNKYLGKWKNLKINRRHTPNATVKKSVIFTQLTS